MIGEEPPPLPFPSLTKLKAPAKDILDAQRNPSSPNIEIKFFQPSAARKIEGKKQKLNKKSCDSCKKKKLKCDNNSNETCKRQSCHCKYHVSSLENETNNNTNKNTPLEDRIIPSTTVFRKPGLLLSGHYAGETSFCGYISSPSQPSVIMEENEFPHIEATPLQPPFITELDQLYLIDVYYENLNPYFPILNKQDMLIQHQLIMKKGFSYLSPLFFYALFARAAHVQWKRKFTQYNQQPFSVLGDTCLQYATTLVHYYMDKPRISTVLALVIMANHLEQTKLPDNLTRSWLWTGECFRLALDLGVHRSLISENNNSDRFGQLCIRAFWLAYITDCTISMTYGRPSATEEKVLDVTSPTRIPSDDSTTKEWLEGLNTLISLSKIAARVIKFNYCPPPPFKIPEPVKRHNAFLASVDSWLTDIMFPNNEPDSPISNTANSFIEESTISKRINFQKKMFLYTNLILLHRPYVNDVVQSRNSTRPSYDICTFAAIIITDTASKLEINELVYHSKSPMTAYALVMALRIHLVNASSTPDQEKFNAEKNFATSIHTLERLPQYHVPNSMIHAAVMDIKEQYEQRFNTVIEEFKEEALFLVKSSPTIHYTEKRKEIPESDSTELAVKQYQPPEESKKKKPKTTTIIPQQHSFVSNKQKQKQKQGQDHIQKSHQHVFSTISTSPPPKTKENPHSTLVNTFTNPQNTPTHQPIVMKQLQQQPMSFENTLSFAIPTQTTYLSERASPSSNVSSNNEFSHIDYSILQQQQDVLYSKQQSMYQQILDDDLNFDYFGVVNDFNIQNDLFPAYNNEMTSTWDVKNENNTQVSITPADTNTKNYMI